MALQTPIRIEVQIRVRHAVSEIAEGMEGRFLLDAASSPIRDEWLDGRLCHRVDVGFTRGSLSIRRITLPPAADASGLAFQSVGVGEPASISAGRSFDAVGRSVLVA